jgi:hypothetical protein
MLRVAGHQWPGVKHIDGGRHAQNNASKALSCCISFFLPAVSIRLPSADWQQGQVRSRLQETSIAPRIVGRSYISLTIVQPGKTYLRHVATDMWLFLGNLFFNLDYSYKINVFFFAPPLLQLSSDSSTPHAFLWSLTHPHSFKLLAWLQFHSFCLWRTAPP